MGGNVHSANWKAVFLNSMHIMIRTLKVYTYGFIHMSWTQIWYLHCLLSLDSANNLCLLLDWLNKL